MLLYNIDLFDNSFKKYSDVQIVKPESPGRDKKLVQKKNAMAINFQYNFSHIMKINDCLPS